MELTKAKYKQTEVGLIPEDWKIFELSELTKKIMVGIASAATHAYRKNGVVLFRNQNIRPNYLDDSDILHINEEYEIQFKGKRLEGGDLLTARTGYPGTTCVVPNCYSDSQSFTTLISRPDKSLVDPYYLSFFINSEEGLAFFERSKIGGGQKNVNASILKTMPIPLPPTLTEQKAIATALSDVDDLIANLDKLITKKKAIKQGAMQQLLTPPHKGGKRLAGFTGDWVEKKLGEVCEIRKGQLITESTRIDGPIPVIAGGKKAAYYHANANRFGKTITISGSGANAGYVAFHNYPIFASDCSTIEESSKYSIEYIYYLLSLMQKQIYNAQTGGAQPHIHPSDLNPMEVSMPKIEEQMVISSILYDMEKEIDQLEIKRAKYQDIKQGMMQELLTGKTRLV